MTTRREFLKAGLKITGSVATAAAVISLPGGSTASLKQPVRCGDKYRVYWTPEVYKVGTFDGDAGDPSSFHVRWLRLGWSRLKPGDIFRFRGLDGELQDEGTDREIHLATGEVFLDPKARTWACEMVPFTVVTADTGPAWSKLRIRKDGKNVGFVYEVNLRTGLMKRYDPQEARAEAYRFATEPGEKRKVLRVIEEPFDYVTVDP